MGAKKRTYQKIPCAYCEQDIATNRMTPHYNNCMARIKHFATNRAERLKSAPIETLNLGEASEAGRMEEFALKIKSMGGTE